MKILKSSSNYFYEDLKYILENRSHHNFKKIDEDVKKIINQVINSGDKALFKYIKKFEKKIVNSSNIAMSEEMRESYKGKIDPKIMNAFKVSIKNTIKFHKKQKPKNYEISESGVKTSCLWKPIQSVGLYVPGGNAIYPSSLIMNVVPAKVAGVKRIVVATPKNSSKNNLYLLALLAELNITEIYQMGGAHAIAALAYGTASIKPVNKIFGPGNSYVASAKKQVFGKVGIDLIAGPSEIVVLADKNNNPDWIAADLIAQAEHDEKSQSILITNNEEFSKKVIVSINKLKSLLPKKKIIEKSLMNYGAIIILDNFKEAPSIINFIAPEHLHLQNYSFNSILKYVHNAGAIFLGEYSSEVFGDYIAGTNHVLPTSGSAKFSSGLGVLDFMKRTSVVKMNLRGYNKYKDQVAQMAKIENLDGHNLSIKIRQIKEK